MTLEQLRSVLLWCTVINYALLLLWVLLMAVAHDGIHRLTAQWFRLSVERFDAINYAGIVLFKIGIFLFNLVPFVALLIVR